MGVPAPSQVVGTSAGDCRRKEGGRLVVVNGVLLCACEGAGARLSQVVPLTCAWSIEGQRPRSSPSRVLSGWAGEAAAEAGGAMPRRPLFTAVAGGGVYP